MRDVPLNFYTAVAEGKLTNLDRAVAFIWHVDNERPGSHYTLIELINLLEKAGCAKQNQTRLRQALGKDRRIIKAGEDGFKLKPTARALVGTQFESLIATKPIKISDSVIPRDILENTREYLVRIGAQLNASYDHGLFDCSAVMARRLIETLVIEVYESLGRALELKGSDGHFFMFAGLLSKIQSDSKIAIGRSSSQGMKDIKALGDLSAHNRRFNAHKSDIDKVKMGLRVAVEELVHLANLSKTN